VNFLLTEERAKNNQYTKQIKLLEETIKTVNNEYQNITIKYGKVEKDEENLEQHYSGK